VISRHHTNARNARSERQGRLPDVSCKKRSGMGRSSVWSDRTVSVRIRDVVGRTEPAAATYGVDAVTSGLQR
jgi:hypothetical protein